MVVWWFVEPRPRDTTLDMPEKGSREVVESFLKSLAFLLIHSSCLCEELDLHSLDPVQFQPAPLNLNLFFDEFSAPMVVFRILIHFIVSWSNLCWIVFVIRRAWSATSGPVIINISLVWYLSVVSWLISVASVNTRIE